MQGDNKSFEITATLYDTNKLYTINTDNIKIKGENPAGLTIQKNVDSHTANTVAFTLTEDMLMYDGLLKLVLVFAESSTQLTTFPFVIKVINSPGGNTADDIKTVSALVEEAKKWAMQSKSYAVGTDNEVRDGDKTDNSKYYYEQSKKSADDSKSHADDSKNYADDSKEYYEQIQDLINNSSASGGTGSSNILYYDTYGEFKADLDAGNIPDETLICIKESKMYFSVKITIADNMSWENSSGKEIQNNVENAMIPVIYHADSGYYFPSDYNIASQNGISTIRNSDSQITISGTPTADTQITLAPPAKAKSTQQPPTGLSDGGLKINGTTAAMEYASSPAASVWTGCADGNTTVTDGTWYVRYKETDSLYASDSVEIVIEALETDTPFEPGTLVALGYTDTQFNNTSPTCYSTDNGQTWNKLKNISFIPPFNNEKFNIIKLCDDNYLFFEKRDSSIYQSKTLKQWTVLCQNNSFSNMNTFYYSNGIMLLGGYNNNSLYSIDGGNTWNQTDLPFSDKERRLSIGNNSFIISEYNILNFCTSKNNSMYVTGGYHGHCYYSYNGRNWNSIAGIYENNQYIAIYFNETFYLIGFLMHYHDEIDDGKIRIYSSSNGISWNKIFEAASGYRFLFEGRADTIYACINNKIVFGTLPKLAVFDTNTNSLNWIEPNIKALLSISPSKLQFQNLIEFKNELYASDTWTSTNLYKSSDIVNWKNVSNYTENHDMLRYKVLVPIL